MKNLRIAYVPYSASFDAPGDRRRFVHYARQRGLQFEIADPTQAYDVVVLSERADLSVWCKYTQGKIVFDLIDSYLAIPSSDWKGLLRGTAKFVSRQSRYLQLNYWQALRDMCRRADAVVCTTNEQRQQIGKFCPNTHIVLDAHSMVVRQTKDHYAAATPFRIVWEGLPQTLNSLAIVGDVLRQVGRHHPVELHVLTDPEFFSFLGRFGLKQTPRVLQSLVSDAIFHSWQESTVAQQICACDLAIIPIDLTDPFVAGKPENKLLLFWRLAMPVLASASPAYRRVMTQAGQNWVCASPAEWEARLIELIEDETARQQAGEGGRRFVEAQYGEQKTLRHWDDVFRSLNLLNG